MKTLILDSNELRSDWLCTGLKYQLLDHMQHTYAPWVSVCVPAVVLEEVVANHAREVTRVEEGGKKLARERRHLGLTAADAEPHSFDYRAYLTERFDERLGFTVLPWPNTPHKELVARATSRTPPFDLKGGGYRDSLVWADAVELARTGGDVILISGDKAFAGVDGDLHPTLLAEIEPLGGTVRLVSNFNNWLVAELPWPASDLRTAVSISRNAAFYNDLLQSDFPYDVHPPAEALGFTTAPSHLEIEEVEWDGSFVPLEGSSGPEGMTLVEYDLGQTVEFVGQIPGVVVPDPGWTVSGPDALHMVRVEGSVKLILRVAVLFGDEFGFTVDALSWRRADGSGPGMPVEMDQTVTDPDQLSLPMDLVQGSEPPSA